MLSDDLRQAAEIAQEYFGTNQLPERLGWGISGYVYLSPDLQTAVKIHRYSEGFSRELSVYRKLRALSITKVCGLTVPKIRDYRNDVKLIQMDFVNAPYLLDFAGVKFDPPDFSSDVIQDWRAKIEMFYGPNSSVAYSVYYALAKHGIYYMDFRPSNMKLEGLPGLEPFAPSGEEDDVTKIS